MGNSASEARPRLKHAFVLIRTLLEQMMPPKGEPSPEGNRANIANLLDRLEYFGDRQIDYFDQNIPNSNPFHEYPIGATISQISHDLEVVERALLQRSPSAPTFQVTLALADQLTYHALRPARNILAPGATVLTYLHKMPLIRVIPYAPVALIAVPYTTLNTMPQASVLGPSEPLSASSLDFLAIPHEVGHYIFWHGHVPSGPPPSAYDAKTAATDLKPLMVVLIERLKSKTLGDVPDVRRWLEEIFADVYGCLVAGPVMNVDFQDLQLNRSMGEFTEDDGEHPIPIMRPDVYRITLEKIGLGEYAAAARERWIEKISGRPYFPRVFDDDKLIPLDESRVSADLELVVGEILDVLLQPGVLDLNDEKACDRRWWITDAPLPPLNGEEIGKLLYDDFLTRIANFDTSGAIPEIPPVVTDEEWVKGFIHDANQARQVGVEFRPVLSGLTPDQVSVLWARGWTTDGPTSYWP